MIDELIKNSEKFVANLPQIPIPEELRNKEREECNCRNELTLTKITNRKTQNSQYTKGISIFEENSFQEHDREILEGGCDTIQVMAYYKPFHICPSDWGIYIYHKAGLGYLTKKIMDYSKLNGMPLEEKEAYGLAEKKIKIHEQGHFGVECLATMIELKTNNAKYIPYSEEKRKNQSLKNDEEAFCNAIVAKDKKFSFSRPDDEGKNHPIRIRITKKISCSPYIHKFMNQQSDGYKDFEDWEKKKFYHNSILKLSENMKERDHNIYSYSNVEFTKSIKKPILKKIPTYYWDDTRIRKW